MAILCGLAGLLTGAFLNLLADRLPDWGQSSRRPYCPYCGQPRPIWAWVSVLAYLGLRPNCKSCSAAISLRHPLVELVTAALFLWLWQQWGWSRPLLLYGAYSTILTLVAVVDIEHRLILNAIIYPALGIALIGAIVYPPTDSTRSALLGGILGLGLLALVYLLGKLFVRVTGRIRGESVTQTAFGLGDVRLGAVIGVMVGAPAIFQALLLAALLGGLAAALYWLAYTLFPRGYSRFTTIPLAPYLVAGAMLTLYLGPVIPSLSPGT